MSTEIATSTAYRINRNLQFLANAERTAASYRKLLDLAKTLPGMEYEVERLTSNLDGCVADADDLRYQLIGLGYEPE